MPDSDRFYIMVSVFAEELTGFLIDFFDGGAGSVHIHRGVWWRFENPRKYYIRINISGGRQTNTISFKGVIDPRDEVPLSGAFGRFVSSLWNTERTTDPLVISPA